MDEFGFHIIEIAIESGLLLSVLVVIWKASAIVSDFEAVKEKQDKHIDDDEENFSNINTSLITLHQGVARIEGRLNGK